MNIWSLIGKALGYLLGLLPAEVAKDFLDKMIDILEKNAQGKPYEAVVMSTTAAIRAILSIPDDDIDQTDPV